MRFKLEKSNSIVVAIVGMAGSGKSEAARFFEMVGYKRVRFGDITDAEVKNRGLQLNEENERTVRQELRKEHGMAAYAILNGPKIDALMKSSNVVVDGLYSWEEYLLMKEKFGERFKIVAVYASPITRYKRLAGRSKRPLTLQEAQSRDKTEIEDSKKGGPIAMADFTLVNETSLDDLKKEAKKVLMILGEKS
jgi:dephospho-CoA kinase